MIQLQVEVCDGVRVSCAAVQLVSDPDINVCISTVQCSAILFSQFLSTKVSCVCYPLCHIQNAQ